MGGGGSINTTHLMAFQEDQNHEKNVNTISVPRKKSRKLFYGYINIERKQKIDVNKGPENIKESNIEYSREKEVLFNKMHFVWAYAQKQNSFNQVIPIFKGWTLNIRTMNNENTEIKKAVETFLPPITSKVTEFSTIQKYLIIPSKFIRKCKYALCERYSRRRRCYQCIQDHMELSRNV